MYNGLTSEMVKERIDKGLVNYDVKVKSKSVKEIILTNSVTLFNFLNLGLGLCVFLVGSYKNLLFLGIVFLNTIIGIFQELKAKKLLSKLKLLADNRVKVKRDNKEVYLKSDEIVLDDLIIYSQGNQVLTDCEVISGEVLVDESFITGETEAISKNVGEVLKAGSFIISGQANTKVVNIGIDNFTGQIISKVSKIDNRKSIIIEFLEKFIKFISIIVIPLGILLFFLKYQLDKDLTYSVISTVAALLGMIPDGLILLTSTVFLVAAITLAKKSILVQDLNCIDSLATIDTFCFDKTGTITNEEMSLEKVINLDDNYDLDEILNAYAYHSNDLNQTMQAIKKVYGNETSYIKTSEILFNSKDKYSSITFKNIGTIKLGAKEVLAPNLDISKYESEHRVLVITHDNHKTKDLKVIGLILLNDTIKENASLVIQKLIKRGVNVKLISGDSLMFLKSIASKVNFKDIKAIDLSSVDDINYDEIAIKYNVFARVTPNQKLELIKALRKHHRVAMMGDGVNDTLALKEADASISFLNAKESAKNVSKIILLKDDFNSINEIIDVGRKSINNLTRSATLFINKTIYSTLLAILFIFVTSAYPFQPIQLTLNNFVLIGVPSFILSMLPNNEKVKGNFKKEVLKNSIPSALIIFLNVVVLLIMNSNYNIEQYISTLAFYLVTFNGFLLLYKICYPFNLLTIVLNIVLIAIYLFAIIFMQEFFAITNLHSNLYIFLGIMFLIDICLFKLISTFLQKRIR